MLVGVWRRGQALVLVGSERPRSLGEWSAVIWKITHRTLSTGDCSPGNEARSTRAVWGFHRSPVKISRENVAGCPWIWDSWAIHTAEAFPGLPVPLP